MAWNGMALHLVGGMGWSYVRAVWFWSFGKGQLGGECDSSNEHGRRQRRRALRE